MGWKSLKRRSRLVLSAFAAAGCLILSVTSAAQNRGPLRPGSRARPEAAAGPARLTLNGTLKELEGNLLTIETSEHGPLPVWLKTVTDYFLEDRIVVRETLNVGDDITVEALQDPSGSVIAIKVTVHLSSLWKNRGDRRTVLRPPAPEGPVDEEDPGRPKLRRQPDSQPAAPGSRLAIPLIERAREQAYVYSENLPNFICSERIKRTERQGRSSGWRTLDVLEADIVYEGGRESYRNIRIDGKPVDREMKQLEGAWSMGEFNSTLLSIFVPASRTEFHFAETSRAAGLPASVYSFQIEQENSRWNVGASTTITPGYRGSVWIHEETARVLRIEVEAFDLPRDFDLDTVEMSVDYGTVSISGSEHFLPVKSANLACWRGTNQCARNEIEFRDYRKFAAESTIVTTDSTIEFEGEQAAEEEPRPEK